MKLAEKVAPIKTKKNPSFHIPSFFGKLNVSSILMVMSLLVLAILILYPFSALLYESIGGEKLTINFYVEAMTNPKLLETFYNTILTSIGATGVALIFGTLFAYITMRTNVPFARTISVLMLFPFFISPFIGGMAWSLILGPVGLANYLAESIFGIQNVFSHYNLVSIIWVMGIYYTPYIFLFTSSALASMNPALEEASAMSGAGHLHTALRVTLPTISPSILSGALLVLASAVSHFSIPLLMGRPVGIYTLTTKIYDFMISYPPKSELASALSVLLLSVSGVGIFLMHRRISKRKFITITGRGFRWHLIDLGKWKPISLIAILFYLIISVALPLFILVTSSFVKYVNFENMQFTLFNWRYILLDHPSAIRSITNSIFLGIIGATTATFLTFIVSFLIIRTKLPGRSILDYLSMVPVGIPATGFAVGILAAWLRAPVPIYGTIWILLISYITIYSPYGMRALTSNLHQLGEELEESSRMCGASLLYTLRKITLPLLKPGLMASWIMIFVGCLREMSSSILLYSFRNEVMSVVTYELWFEGCFSHATPMALIQVCIMLLVISMGRKAGLELKQVV